MENKKLNVQQTMVLIILFIIGSSLVIGVNINTEVEQDSWIALILSFLLTIPLMVIFYRLVKRFPQKNIYEIFDILFGKKLGKVLSLIFLIYCIYLGSIVLRNFSEYVEITTLPETPKLPVMILLVSLTIYLAKSEMSTIGRWGNLILIVLMITITTTVLLSIPVQAFENLQPVLGHSNKSIALAAYHIFLIPFAELIVILGMADEFSIKKKEEKVFLWGSIISGVILIIILVRNILILGAPMMKVSFFNSYEAARILQLGDFLTRIEGIITINLILAGMSKGTIFIISISKGVAHLSKNANYKNLVVPVGLFILAICPFLFEDVVDMFDFSQIFGKMSIPIEIGIPLLLFVLMEFRVYKKKQNQ